jgi:hypothetical protein
MGEPPLGGVGEPPLGGVAEPPLGGVAEPPLGGFVPTAVFTEPLAVVPLESTETDVAPLESTETDVVPLESTETDVVPLESTETDVEPAVVSRCDALGPALTAVVVEAAGVDVEVETETCDGAALALDCVDAGGAETVVDVDVDAAGGAVLALTVALAAGVLADAVTEAEGAEEVETLTDVEAETLGVCGTPGRPSACAGTAKDSHPTAQTAAELTKRKACFRCITFTHSSVY